MNQKRNTIKVKQEKTLQIKKEMEQGERIFKRCATLLSLNSSFVFGFVKDLFAIWFKDHRKVNSLFTTHTPSIAREY